ncbi:MAG: redox-regulated ATPase YchF [Patescibacteria group bacterium]|nr:redox-regulated ATPase YchF [Patescibacteria group bacterium]
MSLKVGIVGLPNVGKSTLFKALTRKSVDIANYPFCTIEPNVGVVEVPDERLARLAAVSKPARIVPAVIEFVDIAGLVAGASRGEGLGNKFLSHIREVDAVCQVVRVFRDPNVTHVHDKIDPKNDIEIINTELIMADLETIKRRDETLAAKAKAGLNPALEKSIGTIKKIISALERGELANSLELDEEERESVYDLHLLTAKPFVYAVNCDEEQIKNKNWQHGLPAGLEYVPFCAKLEAEIADLPPAEAGDFVTALGWEHGCLDSLIVSCYKILDLITFLTTGPDETRAWTVRAGAKAPEAAGVIHTDFEKGFIRAEVCDWKKYVEAGSEAAAKASGWVRTEGRDYIIQDGDVCYFLCNK